ncbi:hypothetical protein [Sphingobium boeckii]|uniref:Uncharacterized protein n=1 Tax=Sphingobium boeckii TaxID=1082345 RepID=A0A7W9EFY7_9SPHN|nr:hypothetical protein [Sphingobium boeckii]MBB5686510.1 hypothetical protein [Sphingobium boeckii]
MLTLTNSVSPQRNGRRCCRLSTIIGATLLFSTPFSAIACRAPTQDFYSSRETADHVFDGVSIARKKLVGNSLGIFDSDIRITKVIRGKKLPAIYRLRWWSDDGRGGCGPPGPAIEKGDKLRIHLKTINGSLVAQGWSKIGPKGELIPWPQY